MAIYGTTVAILVWLEEGVPHGLETFYVNEGIDCSSADYFWPAKLSKAQFYFGFNLLSADHSYSRRMLC